MWVMILIGVFYVFPPVFGAIGRNLLPDLYNGVGAKGTDKIVLELPRLLNEKYAPLGSAPTLTSVSPATGTTCQYQPESGRSSTTAPAQMRSTKPMAIST